MTNKIMNSRRFNSPIYKSLLIFCLMLFGQSGNLFAAPGDLDSSFRPALGSSGGRDVDYVLQPDGKIIVVGDFTILSGEVKSKLARLNADGTLDSSFRPVENILYRNVFLQADGKILTSGFASDENTIKFIRLNTDGSRDAGFNSEVKGSVNSVALESDGKIVIGGLFTIDDISLVGVARLNTDGSTDKTFNFVKFQNASLPQPPQIYTVLSSVSGKIYVGGFFRSVNGVSLNGLIKLNSEGTLDTTFSLKFDENVAVSKLFRQTDGKILVQGPLPGVIRLNADDTIDASFVPPSQPFGYGIRSFFVQTDGKILLNIVNGNINGHFVSRLNTDGTADSSFNANSLDGLVFGVAQDDKILSAFIENVNSGSNTFIKFSRLNSDGSVSNTFEILEARSGAVSKILIQPDGKILVGGTFLSAGKQLIGKLVRLNQNGTVDTSFKPDGYFAVTALVLQSDGKILVGGFISSGSIENGAGIIRLNTDGSRDPSFNSGITASFGTSSFTAIAVQSDGKIYIGGNITHADVSIRGFARLNSDGSLDPGFTVKPENLLVVSIIIQPDGKILVGGKVTLNEPSNFRFAIQRLNPNNTVDTAFSNNLAVNNTNSPPYVSSLALLPNGKILYGNSQLKRLNANGSGDDTFSTISASFPDYALKEISRIAVQQNGKIVIGGYFINLMNVGLPAVNQAYIARSNPDGTIDSTFKPEIGKVFARDVNIPDLAIGQDGGILFGGNFEYVGLSLFEKI